MLNDFAGLASHLNINVGSIQCDTSDVDLLATCGVALVPANSLDPGVNTHVPAVVTSEVAVSSTAHVLGQTIVEQNSGASRVLGRTVGHDGVLSVVGPGIKAVSVLNHVLGIDQVLPQVQGPVRRSVFRGDSGRVSTSWVDMEVQL